MGHGKNASHIYLEHEHLMDCLKANNVFRRIKISEEFKDDVIIRCFGIKELTECFGGAVRILEMEEKVLVFQGLIFLGVAWRVAVSVDGSLTPPAV